MKLQRKKAFFSISAVAKMFSVHQQTVRIYEKEGLLAPKRSEGNTRLFSEEDIDRLEEIIYLTHKLGINLAGVEMILKLKKQIKKMQKDMNKLFEDTKQELDSHAETAKSVLETSAKQLLNIKQNISSANAPKSTYEEQPVLDLDNWDIEYEQDS